MLIYKILSIIQLPSSRNLFSSAHRPLFSENTPETVKALFEPGLLNELTQHIVEHILQECLLNDLSLKDQLISHPQLSQATPLGHKFYQTLANCLDQLALVNANKMSFQLAASDLQKVVVKLMVRIHQSLQQSLLRYYEELDDLVLEDSMRAELERSIALKIYAKITAFDFINSTTFYQQLNYIIQTTSRTILANPFYNQDLLTFTKQANKNVLQAACLLAQGADVNACEKETQLTPLSYAILNQQHKLMQLLLEQGADPNQRVCTGKWKGWPLIAIVLHNKPTTASSNLLALLLSHGANPNVVITSEDTWQGWTPLCMAVHNWRKKLINHHTFVSVLLEQGANPNHRLAHTIDPWQGWTPLTLALRNRHNHSGETQYQVVAALLKASANPNHAIAGQYDWRGWTPLCMAVHNWEHTVNYSAEIVLSLLEHSAEPNHVLAKTYSNSKWEGWSPLALAIVNRHKQELSIQLQIIRYLLMYEARIDTSVTGSNSKQQDMLSLAKYCNNSAVINLLRSYEITAHTLLNTKLNTFAALPPLQAGAINKITHANILFSNTDHALEEDEQSEQLEVPVNIEYTDNSVKAPVSLTNIEQNTLVVSSLNALPSAVMPDAVALKTINLQDKFWTTYLAAMKQLEQLNPAQAIAIFQKALSYFKKLIQVYPDEAGEYVVSLVLGICSLQTDDLNLQTQKEILIKKALKKRAVRYLFLKAMLDKTAQAAEPLNIDCLNYLQALGINLNVKNELGQTPLHLAVLSQNKEFIDWVLIYYPNLLNIQDNEGNTPLLIAVLADYSDSVKTLVVYGARWDLCNNVDQRVDELALNHHRLLKAILLAYQQQLFAETDQAKLALLPQEAWETHFLFAVKTNQQNLVEKILTAGAINLLKHYEQRLTILHIVVQHNYLELIAYFLEYEKGLLETTDGAGRTPLLLATQLGYCQAIELLLNANANLDAVDHHHNSVWELAASLEAKTLLLKFIQKHKNVNVPGITLQQKLLTLVNFFQEKIYPVSTASIVIPGYGELPLKISASDDIHACIENSLTNPNQGGTHPWFIYAGIHFKLNPAAPGLDMSTHLLNQSLFKEGLAPSVYIKLKLSQGEQLALAADAIEGITLEHWLKKQSQTVLNIHSVDFCRLVVLAWLTDPGDNKLDNYLVQSNDNAVSVLRLIGIDNDKVFEPTVVQRVDQKHISYIRCILFLLPQMDTLFNATMRQQLLNLSAESYLLSWLSYLTEYENAYQKLIQTQQFAAEELAYSASPESSVAQNTVQFMRFIPGTVLKLYQKLKYLQSLVNDHQLTYRQIWHKLDPVTASFYQALQEKFSTFKEQVNALYQNVEAGHGETFESLSAFTKSEHLKTNLLNACNDNYQPKIFEAELKAAKYASTSLRTQTLIEAQAELLAAIDWQEMNEVQQLNLINQIALEANLQKTLTFKNCFGLNDESLILLRNLKALQTLTLINCSISLKGLGNLVHLFQPQLHLKLGNNLLLTQKQWQEMLENPLFLQVSCILADGSEIHLKPLKISSILETQTQLQKASQTDELAKLIWTFWQELTWVKTLLQANQQRSYIDNQYSLGVSNFFVLNANEVIDENEEVINEEEDYELINKLKK